MEKTGLLVDKFREQLNVFDRNKIGYNFVFMFASPSHLLISTQSTTHQVPFDPLSYRKEYRLIKDSLKRAKKEITVHKVHGTQFNFSEVLEKQRPGAIHFSGHGVTAEQIRKQNKDR
jgi:hypothetical protein